MKVLNKNKGFTLVELIVVIAIIGILASVLIPSITGYIGKAKESAAMQEAKSLETSYFTWLIEREDYEEENPAIDDFELYLTGLNVLSTSQDVRKINISYLEGFRFLASNGIEIEAVFDPVTKKLTMAKVE